MIQPQLPTNLHSGLLELVTNCQTVSPTALGWFTWSKNWFFMTTTKWQFSLFSRLLEPHHHHHFWSKVDSQKDKTQTTTTFTWPPDLPYHHHHLSFGIQGMVKLHILDAAFTVPSDPLQTEACQQKPNKIHHSCRSVHNKYITDPLTTLISWSPRV